MVYRKGERRIAKAVRPYTHDHPVAASIRSGSWWFNAWVAQKNTSYQVLTKRTGIAGHRLMELSHGAEPTPTEVIALASAWYVEPEGLQRSISDAKAG